MESRNEGLSCPVCGSTNIASKTINQLVGIPSTPQETASVFEDTCTDCGTRGDFGDRNDFIIEQSLKRSEELLIEGAIKHLSSLGISMAYMERALGLPQRAVMLWKKGEHSASVVALLQLIRTYPWLLKVAERGFDRRYAQTSVLEQAVDVEKELAMEKLSDDCPPDPEYLVRRGSGDPKRVFDDFSLGERQMLETPSKEAIEEYRRTILRRHGR
jgi:hypothetical protein